MSRCLPFSREMFAIRRSNNEALIKLHKEKEIKAEKLEKKELKKKLKKELKKKLKRELIKENGEKLSSQHPSSKGLEKEASDTSGVTEERHLPTTCSPGIQINNKRKRQGIDDSFDGTGLRIRISLKEHRDPPKASSLSEQSKKLPSKVVENFSQVRATQQICHKSTARSVELKQPTQQICHKSTARSVELKQPTLKPHLEETNPKSVEETMYKLLMTKDLIPPNFDDLAQTSFDYADEDWLLGSRNQLHSQDSKRQKSTSPEEISLYPRAKYLSDVGIFALPYAVYF